MTHIRTRRISARLAAAAAVASLAAACGSSSSSTTSPTTTAPATTSTAAAGSRSAIIACLKQHGITRPPGSGSNPTAAAQSNPKFRAALQACGGGKTNEGSSPSKAEIKRFVSCVDHHGDKLPAPNLSGNGPVLPASVEHSKRFQSAAKACASTLRS